MTRLHPRSATVTWAAPAPPNGIVANYTACLCPRSVCGNVTNSSLRPDDVGKHLDSDQDHGSSVISPELSPESVSAGEDDSSSVQNSKPGVTKEWQSKSPSNGSVLIHPNSTDGNPRPTSPSATSEVSLETERGPTSGCFSSASDPGSLSRSVTVSANSTSYTFLDLRPYQIYTSQVRTGQSSVTWW